LFVHICSFAGLMYYRSDFSDERIREELEMMCDDPGFEALLKRYKPSGLKNIAACFMLKSKMIPLYHFMCKGLYSSKK
ncbi:MAG: hypothetical protein Q4E57_10610, partial [Eubacteriales bacterium]|nr:hypothetical protein [Eubacteriales bacterium]